MNTGLRKKADNDFEEDFFSWWIMKFSEKPFKMREKIEILNLLQEKQEIII